MTKIFIIHGWGGSPKEAWFPWLKTELERRGYAVTIPAMPNPDEPKIETWVPYLAKIIGQPDEHTFLIGHSIGCQTILRYLQTLRPDQLIGGALFVCGWLLIRNLKTEDEKRIVGPWVNTPIDLPLVKTKSKKMVAIFSDNDPFVPLENEKRWQELLDAEIIIEHNKGHLGASEGFTELPSALSSILKMIEGK